MIHDASNARSEADRGISDEAVEWLVHLHSGRATAANRAAFAAWRQRSPAHEAAAREAEALWDELPQTRTAAVFAHDRAERKAYPAAQTSGRIVPFGRYISRRTVLAGGVAAFAAIVLAGSGAFGPASGVFADYATRTGERREIRLSDGSVVTLNTATALSVNYSATERRLILHTGEALFEVAAEPVRPFIVAAAAGEAQALGTVFAVRRDAEHVRILVAQGTVEVRLDGASRLTKLQSGEQTSFGADPYLTNPRPVDFASVTAWTRGKLIFNRRPLAHVVAEFERYHRGWIFIMDERLKGLKISGVFDLDQPDEFLRTLEQTLQVSVVRLPLLTLIR